MPMLEYQCARGHVTEDLRPADCNVIVCPTCSDLLKLGQIRISHDGDGHEMTAHRILSPTRTTFVFADDHRKRTSE